MIIEPLNISLKALPLEVELEMPFGTDQSSQEALIASVKSQLRYDSRFNEDPSLDFNVTLLKVDGGKAVLKIEVISPL